ncbi:FAD/NAD(P)-binding domain-containing protein, partial [Trichoderma citrinoviride]
MAASDLPVEDHDIVVIGAGLSGINAAHRLQTEVPHRTFTILEARDVIAGTWSFFKYPGMRSDSSMRSFGFAWHPWKHSHNMASAAEILAYLEDAAKTDGTLDKIRLGHRVVRSDWSSDEQRWTLEVDVHGSRKLLKANFIFSCVGYYSYEQSLKSPIPGINNFEGTVVHPQWWPEDLDYSDKRVVIIGSGATAITLLPAMAETAKSVTMLQRTPSYVISVDRHSKFESLLSMVLPLSWVCWVGQCIDVWFEVFISELCLRWPRLGRYLITLDLEKKLPKKVDAAVHFNPTYGPFEQRLCLTPDDEFFNALHRDNVEVVTDVIDTADKDGVVLKSGRHLPADIIVTATGLHIQILSGIGPHVDGKAINVGEQYAWRGCMIEGVPNLVSVFGYVTTTWTPGADSMTKLGIRVLKQMEAESATSVVPVIERTEGMPRLSCTNAKSSYFVKAWDRIPKATGIAPYYGRLNLVVDYWALWFGNMRDGLVYTKKEAKKTK